MSVADLQYILGMIGTVAFAVTGVLAVSPRGIDFFGACVLGLITAIGGGTIRDVILGVPVIWAADLNYIWVALGASFLAFLTNRHMTRKEIFKTMLYLDALGVSMFAIQAAQKVMWIDFGMPIAPVLLGVLTAIGGGLLRDVLAGQPTLLMRREIYAIPVTLGCILFVALVTWLPQYTVMISIICSVLIMSLRSAAICWDLHVPLWLTIQPKENGAEDKKESDSPPAD
ncbi:trimeric intracellular cation channel family protein [Gimesia chilikensis]|uniref:trimeric intracellular cation channel family protein n=1 Tax=Gimesia chilikensis TaxID=2605989 RepID=UPI003A8D5876